MRQFFIAIVLAACFVQAAFSQKLEIYAPPQITGAVNDYAEMLDAKAEKSLAKKLKRINSEGVAQIAVVTVNTIGEWDIYDASLATARSWTPSFKDSSQRRMLIFIAKDDRKYFTQITRDLEGDLTNGTLGDIQRQFFVPAFRQEQYDKGINDGIDAIAAHLVKNKNVAGVKTVEPAKPKSSLAGARQMILVITENWDSVGGVLRRFERKKAKGKWRKVGEDVPIVVGKKGLAWGTGLHDNSIFLPEQPIKKEGDGKSPAGAFALVSAFGTAANANDLKLPYTPLVESTECVDDVKSGKYNTIVDRFKVGNFDWDSSEKMLAVGEQYALGVFVAHNSSPVRKGGGSCIFLHIWQNDATGTSGCTAMQKENMNEIARWLDAKQSPVLVQLPASELARLQKTWKLPKTN